jgi:hypothetical protein
MAYPGGPAGQGPGTSLRGPIYVSPYQGRKLADVALADEFGILRASNVLNDNYYPLGSAKRSAVCLPSAWRSRACAARPRTALRSGR